MKENLQIKKSYVETSYGVIHYRTAGNIDKPHVLLLHQTASSSVMYESVMNLLVDKFYLFAPDTPGFGGSDFPQVKANMQLYADSLREAADNSGLDNPFVFGHHTGASIAVQMEFDRPFAKKMILSGPPLLTREQKNEFKNKTEPIVIKESGSHLMKLWQRFQLKDPNGKLELRHREYVLNLKAGERYHEAYHAVFDHDFEMQIAALACPILVMAGDSDTLKDSLEPAFNALQNGTIKRLIGNTYICDQSPDVVAAIICEYFV